jgi:hypothetical protein
LISYTAAGVSALEKAELTPFTDAGFVTGDLISMSQANAAIKTSWDAWVVASGNAAVFGTMIFKMILNPWGAGSTYVIDPVNGDVTPYIIVKPSALSWAVVSNWFNQPYNTELSPQFINNSDQLMILGTRYRGSVYDQGANGDGGGHSFPAVGIKFDQPPGTIPSSGVIVADTGKWSFTGSSYATTTGTTIFTGLGFLGSAPPGSLVEGQSVQLSFANTGTMSTVLLAMLHSSGENALRNAYDTLPSTSGLGLPTSWVDDETISTALVAGYWAMFNLEAGPGRRSIGDAVCSSLALAGIAIAPAADSQRLTVIYTTASVSGASVTITDAMLISLNGVVADVGKIEPPNSVVVTLNSNGAEESEIQVNDVDRIASEGAVRAEFTLSAIGGADVTKAVMSWGTTRLVGDAHASTVTLAVAPWVLLQVGDAVNLALTNPSLWDVDTGTAGVTAAVASSVASLN